jgi:TrkA domain protein
VNVVAIRRGGETIDSPTPDTALSEGDTLIVTGTREECENFEGLLTGAL